MIDVILDEGVKKDCWNLRDSYGEICVHCGCCDEDLKVRTESRVRTLEIWIEELESFDEWDEDPLRRAFQEDSIQDDLKTYKQQMRYYKKRLRGMTDGQNA